MPQSLIRIALVFDNALGYCRAVQRGVNRFAAAMPQWTLLTVAPHPRELATLRSLRPDGLIAHVFQTSLALALTALRKPLVNVSTVMELPIPSIGADNKEVGRVAARHLLDRGFRHFGWVGHDRFAYAVQQECGFRQTVEAAGYTVSSLYDRWERTFHPRGRLWGLNKTVHQWLASLPKPVGVLASHDLWGVQLTEACRHLRLRVPEDVALVGVDNDDLLCVLARPPLSSVALPAEQVGYEAATLLARLLAGASPRKRPPLLRPLGVVARQSSDVLAVTDPEVVAAIRFIREHSHLPIDVSDVLRAVPVGRRSLERRFRQVLRRGIWDEIRRVHLERAKTLLDTTRLTVADVAERAGFSNHAHLCVVFRQETGLTPTAYRRQTHSPMDS